jgi:hypothetical protein
MGLLRLLARAFVLKRLFRGRRPPSPPGVPPAYSPYRGLPPGNALRRRGRVGLFGPFPYYSTTTRRGARVSVGGCCLPIPLALLATVTAASVQLLRRITHAPADR